LQEPLQVKYTGGTVFHTFLGEAIPDYKACMKLVKTIAEMYRIPYFTISPTFSICPRHGYLNGEHIHCELCANEEKAKIQGKIEKLYKTMESVRV